MKTTKEIAADCGLKLSDVTQVLLWPPFPASAQVETELANIAAALYRRIEELEKTNDQLALNGRWLMERTDAIQLALCPGKMGTWQQRAEQATEAARALSPAITEAKAALVGDSNDAEHDALFGIVNALGYEMPECECDQHPHDLDCPCVAWEVQS